MPAGASRDAAVAQIINVEGANDLPSAFNWAVTIGNDNSRADAINRVVQQWARADPNAAIQAIQSANVSDDQRANLMSVIQRLAPPSAN